MATSEAFPAASHYIDGLIATTASLLIVKVMITEYCFILYLDLSLSLRRPTSKNIFSSNKDSSTGNKYFTVCNERCKQQQIKWQFGSK